MAIARLISFFDDDKIAVADLVLDHGVAANAEDEALAWSAGHVGWDGDALVDFDGFDRGTRGNRSNEGEHGKARFIFFLRNRFQGARPVPGFAEQAFFDEVLDVAMHGGHGRQTDLGRDLLETVGVTLLFDKGRNEVKDLSLSPSECHRVRHLRVSFGAEFTKIWRKSRVD